MNAKQRAVVLRGGTGENHEWLKFVAGVRTGKDQQKNCSMDMLFPGVVLIPCQEVI
jgi:hypothetical protein